MKALVHIVTWNDRATIARCLQAVREQQGFVIGDTLHVRVTDNASTDGTAELLRTIVQGAGMMLVVNPQNIGFAAAHNQGVSDFLQQGFDALLVLNPDVRLQADTLAHLCAELASSERIGMVTPKLLRATPDLEPLHPPVLDAAGMALYPSLRHLDRGSGELDIGQFSQGEFVFGGTGACLLLRAECLRDLLLPNSVSDESVFQIYPQLRYGHASRPKLFDEAFFAYREDADLSWRALRLNWRCWYTPKTTAYHVRAVTPEKRVQLPAEINLYGVRNRFLLQFNNWTFQDGIKSFVEGILMRNFVVILGVILREQSSFQGLVQALRLFRRAQSIRAFVKASRQRNAHSLERQETARGHLSAHQASGE